MRGKDSDSARYISIALVAVIGTVTTAVLAVLSVDQATIALVAGPTSAGALSILLVSRQEG